MPIISSIAELPRTGVLTVLGPTASGKSQWTEEILEVPRTFLIGCDSVHLYRELRIGSTRPDDRWLASHPHACVAEFSIDEKVSAADYQRQAMKMTLAAQARGDGVLVSGGSVFYFLGVARGLAAGAPPADTTLRERLRAEYEADPEALHEEMLRLDPALEGRVHWNDAYRVMRAVEVMRLTGKPWSLLQGQREDFTPWVRGAIVVLHWETALLRARIRARTKEMLKLGWIDEVRELLDSEHDPSCPGLRTVGYKDVVNFLQGKLKSIAELESAIELNTWHLARKQMTFLRSLTKQFTVCVLDGAWAVSDDGRKQLRDYWIGCLEKSR